MSKEQGILHTLRAWITSSVHIIIFTLDLSLFHLPLVLARQISIQAMDKVLSYFCLVHTLNIRITGSRYTIRHHESLDPKRPVILVSNHQSMYDIPIIIWNLRDRNPKFIAKKELRFVIPSISYALRHGEHLIIDRGRAKEAMKQIGEYGKQSEALNRAVCIFPEGTRSKTGIPGTFKAGGFAALLKSMPTAQIVPVTIDGTDNVVKKHLMPVGLDSDILVEFHPAIPREGKKAKDLLKECEDAILQSLQEWRKVA